MAFVFELPEVGEGVVEAEVVSWNVKEGDFVTVDQPLCEITTDKAQLEISSPRAGRVLRLHGKPGDIIKVHAPLCEIDTDATGAPARVRDDAVSHADNGVPAPTPAPRAPLPSQVPTVGPAVERTAPPPAPDPSQPTRAAPAVRREAREMGIDLRQVPGTGPSGRIMRGDLQAFGDLSADDTVLPATAPRLAPALPQVGREIVPGTEQRVPLIGIRRKIAQQMSQSKHTAAHFTYVEEVDCGELVTLRKAMKEAAAERGIKLTYIPILMKAVSVVLHQFPNLNAVMDEEKFELVVKGDHNIGISTDTPNGLYVPVIKNVEQKSILEIAAEMDDLVTRTRAGKARLDELKGGTFTMTSVGSIGGVLATPILNIPEVAILGVNAIRDQAVVRDGQIVVRPMMFLSPSFDHRVIDGALGARFVAALKAVIEHPERLFLELR
ncbi:MAG: dihydrolipoamide acetyltransferase family protein [Myxococcota bacterium]